MRERPIYRSIRNAGDAIATATVLREIEFSSCADVFVSLAALGAADSNYSGRELRGLVVDALELARPNCPGSVLRIALSKALREPTRAVVGAPVHWIALSLVAQDNVAALESLEGAPAHASVLLCKAKILIGLRRDKQARAVLEQLLRESDDVDARAQAAHLAIVAGDVPAAMKLCAHREEVELRRVCIAALAATSRYREAADQIRSLPLHLREEASEYAMHAAVDALALASTAEAPVEVLVAVAKARSDSLPDRGVSLWTRASALGPGDADVLSELAEAQESVGKIADAIQSWDRAAPHAQGAERPLLVPIRLLAENGKRLLAIRRAQKLAQKARSLGDSRQLRLAAFAYKYAGDAGKAIALARAAVAARPGDGRLKFELAMRLEEGGRVGEAAEQLLSLLACGARGRAWHRHEVASRLARLMTGHDLRKRLEKVPCDIVSADNLANEVRHMK